MASAEVSSEKSPQKLKICAFYIKKKNRNCRVIPCKGSIYCAEHIGPNQDCLGRKRLPCPLDPKHSCYADKLEKHLKKCNSREMPQPAYFAKNVNSGPELKGVNKVSIRSVPSSDVLEIIEKVKHIYKDNPVEIVDEVLFHESLTEESKTPGYGEPALKHINQQASIIGQLDRLKWLNDNTIYVEFGAGKGHLAHWTVKSVPHSKNNSYVTIDRGSIKHKLDMPHIYDSNVDFHRLKIDIKDLKLDEVECIKNRPRQIVAMSKHLCGVATDLTLQCLVKVGVSVDSNSSGEKDGKQAKVPKVEESESSNSFVKGAVIALCCHHRCDWNNYCGHKFFTDEGLAAKDFQLMYSLSSWAICGFATKEEEGKELAPIKFGNLTNEYKEHIGRMCKRVIDLGRMKYLQENGFYVTFKRYIDSSVSPENIMMVIEAR
ncbi:tRNA:m(4)X modification enzyme TRM13 homolog [Tubulanus polymorphus]|uniref:tRNA:m(4)X modification enzyme TRM13 homolog n=1 Tax=Tubulanus polymorphus TaxID=672921 RepID=UPI003DA60336